MKEITIKGKNYIFQDKLKINLYSMRERKSSIMKEKKASS